MEDFKSVIVLKSYLRQWILNHMPMKLLTLTLLYRSSRHGWKASKFHELCDEKGPTITVMRSYAGRVFGGFTMQNWDSVT